MAGLVAGALLCAAAHAQRAPAHVVRVPVAPAAAPSSVQTIELGAVFEGMSVTRTLEFANRTSEPATVSEIRLTHGSGVAFSADNCTGRTVAPGQACTFAATATVDQAGPYLASVQLLHSANPVPDVWYLRATGLAHHASLQTTPQGLSFGVVALGAQSPPQGLSVQNTGTRAVALAGVSAQGGAGWQVQAADCLRELAPGASCSLQVAFAPIARGTADAHLLALLGDGTTAALAALSGAGGSGFAQFSHSLLQWMDATVGADTTPRRLTLTNAGNAALDLGASSTLAIEGGGGAFRVFASTCTGGLAPAQSCTVDVVARLPDATSRAATLRVVDAGGQSQGTSVELFAPPAAAGGAGAQAALQLSAPALDFGAVQLGQSADLPLTLRSVGSAAVSVQAPTLSGAGAARFQVLNPTHCAGLLPVGHECTLSVRFTPAELPAALASLRLTSDSATPVADVTLRGEGAGAAQLSVSSNSLHFGTVATHTTERRQILVSNPGNLPLHFTAAPAVSGAAAFAAGQTNCGAVLAVGASCAVEVSFGSATPGTFAGALTIEAAAAQSPQTVALSGTAFNPVSLGAATLPEGRLGRAFGPFDFRTLLSVSNESTPDLTQASWQVTAGALPAGLSLDAATGVLSGTPTELTAGQDFTVAATYRNNQGQQGFTIRVGEGLLQAVQVEAGESHTCALTPAGAVMCWGANGAGQLGDGTTTSRHTPVQVVGLSSGVVRISAHSGHTCALTNAGAMLCWGDNSRGQLGDGTTTNRSAPMHPAGLSSGVADISAGFWQTCAVTTGGQGLCWGDGNMAEIPAGATSRRLPYPVVGLDTDVASISAGWYRACAVTVAGRALCWGVNGAGELGDGTLTTRHTATQVFGLSSGVASISAGTSHTCAVTTAGRALCWGANIEGAVGDGTTTNRRWPTQVSGLTEGVVGISAGAHHACAAISGGRLLCWGRNFFGHLGDGTLVNRSIPTQVLGAESGFAGVSAGGGHTCASTSAGTLRCWGGNFSGELGDGTTTNRTTPVPVSD